MITIEELLETLGLESELYNHMLKYELVVRRNGRDTQKINEITIDTENDYIIIEID